MSAYEFWDELGNIFNAIVAYQEKTIEFNKTIGNKFLVVPWIPEERRKTASDWKKLAVQFDALADKVAGTMHGIFSVMIDIDEDRRLREALERQEANLRFFAENIAVDASSLERTIIEGADSVTGAEPALG